MIVISRIRQKLLEAGTNTIATLPKVYKTTQSYDGNQKVNYTDFFSGIEMYGIILRKEEKTLLVKYFDKENDGKINFDDFLFAVRGKPNEDRQKIIDLVYYKFDKQKTGFADPAELRKVFNCVRHPRYLTGELTEDQIFFLYLQNFVNKTNVSKKVNKYINQGMG